MITQKKYLNLTALLVALITGVLFLPGLSNAAVTVEKNYDFGEVDVGTSSLATLNISTDSNNSVSLIGLGILENDCVFSISPEVSLPTDLPLSININYVPSKEGLCTSYLFITTIDLETNAPGRAMVTLTGTGVIKQKITIDGILDFFDSCVDDGSLEGYVPDKSDKKRSAAKITKGNGSDKLAENRLNALRNMIETAGHLIDSGKIDEACGQLKAAYKKIKIDGSNTPESSSFFVKGTKAKELADKIQDLMDIECK
jgi:uncharacterized membrane protein